MDNPANYSPSQFVNWLRHVAPYVHAFKDKTFVIGFGGELVKAGLLNTFVQDISLLHAMGMRIVLVYGSRPQVEEQLLLRQIPSQFHHGLRVTNDDALEACLEAVGELRLDIEAWFSQGLPNTPMAHSRIRVISGNFVSAKPMGVIDGVDLEHTGIVRKIDAETISMLLANETIVLLPSLGFSPTGEAFNLAMEDVATQTAKALHADKLIFITETNAICDPQSKHIGEMDLIEVDQMLSTLDHDDALYMYLKSAATAIRSGLSRVHIVPFAIDGSLLLELFTHNGVGTMIVDENLENLRQANLDDVGAILSLIEPLEQQGVLVTRGRHQIEKDIEKFFIIEHDGIVFGCAALYPYPKENTGELACLAVAPHAQGSGDGERLLKRIELQAKILGLDSLFVLTTQTEHWFLKRGFIKASFHDLPKERQERYNHQRRSLVLWKKLPL